MANNVVAFPSKKPYDVLMKILAECGFEKFEKGNFMLIYIDDENIMALDNVDTYGARLELMEYAKLVVRATHHSMETDEEGEAS